MQYTTLTGILPVVRIGSDASSTFHSLIEYLINSSERNDIISGLICTAHTHKVVILTSNIQQHLPLLQEKLFHSITHKQSRIHGIPGDAIENVVKSPVPEASLAVDLHGHVSTPDNQVLMMMSYSTFDKLYHQFCAGVEAAMSAGNTSCNSNGSDAKGGEQEHGDADAKGADALRLSAAAQAAVSAAFGVSGTGVSDASNGAAGESTAPSSSSMASPIPPVLRQIFEGLGTIIMATPHKDIDTIIECARFGGDVVRKAQYLRETGSNVLGGSNTNNSSSNGSGVHRSRTPSPAPPGGHHRNSHLHGHAQAHAARHSTAGSGRGTDSKHGHIAAVLSAADRKPSPGPGATSSDSKHGGDRKPSPSTDSKHCSAGAGTRDTHSHHAPVSMLHLKRVSCKVCDIADNHETLAHWTSWHAEKAERLLSYGRDEYNKDLHYEHSRNI